MGLALMGFGEPAIKDRSVLGRWTFNDGASSADVSGWGGSAFTIKSGTMSFKESGSFDGTGYLDITSSGSATATLGGGAFHRRPAQHGRCASRQCVLDLDEFLGLGSRELVE